MMGGDFTPLKRAELSFSSLEFTEGWQMPISVVPALGLDTIYVPKHARSTTRRRRVLRPSKDGLDLYNSGFANARPNGVGRNTLQGPGYMELDVRWSHDFLLSRKGEKGPLLTFAADAFNAVNHVNYSQFIGNERSPFFERAVSSLPGRRLQFTLRFKF
jgi:hypothetical protein